jgi:hypothetical protein
LTKKPTKKKEGTEEAEAISVSVSDPDLIGPLEWCNLNVSA